MEILYSSNKLDKQCNNIKEATKLFGGNKVIAISLLARINALKQANVLKDIILQPQFHFHKLENKGKRKNYEGYFAIDVKGRKDGWRIVLEPLDDKKMPFHPCNIDEVSSYVRIIEIREVVDYHE